MGVVQRNRSRTYRVRIARAEAKGQPSVGIVNPRWLAGAGVAVALATAASMSAGGRAREMIIVNGDREFAARFVIIEQREQISF